MSESIYHIEIRHGDTIIATVTDIELDDWPWHSGSFHPTAEFERYRHLFDLEREILDRDGPTEEWNQVYEQLLDLQLILFENDTVRRMGPFFGHIDPDKVRFRAV